jgi:hypothetical protein
MRLHNSQSGIHSVTFYSLVEFPEVKEMMTDKIDLATMWKIK